MLTRGNGADGDYRGCRSIRRVQRSRSGGMLKGPPKMRNYDRATATNAEMLAITSAIVALVFALRAARTTTHASIPGIGGD